MIRCDNCKVKCDKAEREEFLKTVGCCAVLKWFKRFVDDEMQYMKPLKVQFD